jgi:hypothetical protein
MHFCQIILVFLYYQYRTLFSKAQNQNKKVKRTEIAGGDA